MKFKIQYKNGNEVDITILECSETVTVKEYKIEISKIIDVLPQYIILKYNDIYLRNDICLREYVKLDDSVILIHLEVVVRNIYESTDIPFIMNYEDYISDLGYKYCTSMKIPNVTFTCDGVCKENDYLKQYMKQKDCIFTSITVRVISQDGGICGINSSENETVKSIRTKLLKSGFLNKRNAILMMENSILIDTCELYKYRKVDPFIIYIGFVVYFNKENERVYELSVNFDTKISFLIMHVANKLCKDPNRISLMKRTEYLEDDKTVGFYKLNGGDELEVVINFKLTITRMIESNIIDHFVRNGDRVSDIKDKLSKKLSIDVNEIILLFNDELWLDDSVIDTLTFDTYKRISMFLLKPSNNCHNNINSEINEIIEPVDPQVLNDEILNIADTNKICTNQLLLESGDNVKIVDPREIKIDLNPTQCSQKNDSLNSRNAIGQIDEQIENDQNISLMIVNLNGKNDDIPRIVVNKTSSIQDLRSAIYQHLEIGMRGLDVYFLGDVFSGGTLDRYNIIHNCAIVLKKRKNLRNVNEQYILNVKNQENGKISNYMIDNFMTIEGLKNILRKEYNVNVNRINLKIGKMEMTDETVIRELDIENNSTAILIIEDAEDDLMNAVNVKVRNYLNVEDRDSVCYINVSTDDAIGTIREKIEKILNFQMEGSVLSYHGEILKESNVFSTYNIQDGDKIAFSESLLIRYFTGSSNATAKVNRYSLLPSDNVSDLKLKIKKMLNIEPRFINLAFGGDTLEDEVPLKQYGIENNSYIMMVATLAGGDWFK